jgi:uncharacterized protein (TIGR02265 family)
MQPVSRRHPSYQDEFAELRRCIEATPSDATVKGMYVDSFLQSIVRKGLERPTDRRFVSFKDYPLREFQELLLQTTAALYPTIAPREGLRLIGRLAYPTLAESTVGRILFAIAGRDWHAALPLARRAYEISLKPGRAELKDVTETSALMCLRDVWNFADSYQVGVFEGAMECYLINGTVRPRPSSRICDIDLVMRWE